MLQSKKELVFLVFALLLIGFQSYGQSMKDSLQYKVDLNISGRKISGTFDQLVAGAGFNVDLRYKYWHLENNTRYQYNETNDRLIEDNWYDLLILKYYPKGSRKLYPGVFYHFDNNLIYRVDARHQYGVGLGSVLDKGSVKLSLLAAIANEQTRFNGSDFVNSERDFSNRENGLFLFRLNNAYSFAKKKINFSYQFFYFQSLKETSDYDIWVNAKLNFRILKGLSFHIVYDYRFENVHLETLSNYNDIILFGLNYALTN